MLLEAQQALDKREERLDAETKRQNAEFNKRELALRHIAREQAEAKAANVTAERDRH